MTTPANEGRLLRRLHWNDVDMREETFSLNDFASNGGHLVAGGLLMWLGQPWPDLVIGVVVALLAIKGGVEILQDAAGAKPEEDPSE